MSRCRAQSLRAPRAHVTSWTGPRLCCAALPLQSAHPPPPHTHTQQAHLSIARRPLGWVLWGSVVGRRGQAGLPVGRIGLPVLLLLLWNSVPPRVWGCVLRPCTAPGCLQRHWHACAVVRGVGS